MDVVEREMSLNAGIPIYLPSFTTCPTPNFCCLFIWLRTFRSQLNLFEDDRTSHEVHTNNNETRKDRKKNSFRQRSSTIAIDYSLIIQHSTGKNVFQQNEIRKKSSPHSSSASFPKTEADGTNAINSNENAFSCSFGFCFARACFFFTCFLAFCRVRMAHSSCWAIFNDQVFVFNRITYNAQHITHIMKAVIITIGKQMRCYSIQIDAMTLWKYWCA